MYTCIINAISTKPKNLLQKSTMLIVLSMYIIFLLFLHDYFTLIYNCTCIVYIVYIIISIIIMDVGII